MQWKSYRYRHTAGGIVITQYVPETEETSVQIPAVLEGSPVTEIGEEAFAENGAFLERVEIPSSVKRIGDGAFKMCMSLTELILHSGLETVGAEALYLTPVEELYLPDTVSALGQPWELGGIRFRISPLSFFQVNPHQAERLYTIAMNMADLREDDTVIDAYCGTGTIALIAAHVSGCRVIGVESNPEAVRDAEANARLNGLDNVSFITADASKYMKEMAKKGEHCSVLFLDPPRSGASEEFLAAAGRMAPERIVYISCNPETLGRDLRYIHRFLPYKTRGIQPVDLFPASAHIETAVFLDRY